MPKEVDWRDYFDIDRAERFTLDNSPRYEEKVLEETADYRIRTTKMGRRPSKNGSAWIRRPNFWIS